MSPGNTTKPSKAREVCSYQGYPVHWSSMWVGLKCFCSRGSSHLLDLGIHERFWIALNHEIRPQFIISLHEVFLSIEQLLWILGLWL